MKELTPVEAKVMRGIIAREHRRAAAERRSAAGEAPPPPDRPAAWQPKAKLTIISAAEKKRLRERAAFEAERRAAWAKRHPALAAEERALRKASAQAVERYGHKAGGTPQTFAHVNRPREGAIARLYRTGAIDQFELAAAEEILAVYERIAADVTVSVASMETRVDVSRYGDAFFESLTRVRMEVAYGRWRAALLNDAAMVLEIVVHGVGLVAAARQHGMSTRRAKGRLIHALGLWLSAYSEARNEVDPATLAAAQAGVL